MIIIDEKKYCCFLVGSGILDEGDPEDKPLPIEIPAWVQNQGEFKVDGLKWDIAVGISHADEEWRQDADIKEFMISCHYFLDEIASKGIGKLTIVMNYSKDRKSICSIDSATAGLLSSLRISLDIHWMFEST